MTKIMETKLPVIYMPEELREKIREMANERKWGTAQTVRHIIEEYFERIHDKE